MNKNRIFLILICIFTLILFSSNVMANNNIYSNKTNTISLEDTNTNSESVNEIHIVDGSSVNQMNNPTIQKAINDAKSGDTIEITGKEYEHCHFIINKKLTIISKVGTSMSPCPSNIQGSDGIGIFYISNEGSGTVISGFTLINEEYKSGSQNPYCIYVNGASDVTITNSTILKTQFGPGIFLNDASNTKIINTTIKSSKKGIYLENCKDTLIKNNEITSNSQAGIYVGDNSNNLNIYENLINGNNYYGIFLGSAKNTYICNNKILDNRDNPVLQRAEEGVGICVNTTVTNLQIKGNLIKENGRYGIFDGPKFTNMIDQNVQIVDGNYFIHHNERGIFHADPNGQTTIVYVWSNYYSNELFCGGTSYEPGILISNHERDLIMGPVTEIKKGIYSVSFIRADTKEVSTSLNAVEVTFYLNKNSNYPVPSEGDIYRVVPVINGTAIADFRNETYLPSNNSVIAVGLGSGVITLKNSGSRPSQELKINDSHIPGNNTKQETKITGNSLVKYVGNSNKYEITLTSENQPINNKQIQIIINGDTYNRNTDSNGKASMNINLASGKYEILLQFNGDDDYEQTSTIDIITIKSTIEGKNITKYFQNGTQYSAKFYDNNGVIAPNTPVSFNINGVFYNRTTDKDGIATMKINLPAGTYTLTAKNSLNTDENSDTVIVLPTIVKNENITKYFHNDTQFSLTVLDKTGKVANDREVSLNINGIFYKRTTDKDGIATMKINLPAGTYIITIESDGFVTSNTITVLPILKSSNVTMRDDNRTQFSVKLLDNSGKLAINKTVTFNINGIFYNRTSDIDGLAKLNIRLPIGSYIITSKYNGFVTSNVVEILKTSGSKSTSIISSNLNQSDDKEDNFTVFLKDEDGKYLKNQNIKFQINNEIINVKTNSDGCAKLKITLPSGNYSITTTYEGNEIYKPCNAVNKLIIYSIIILEKATNSEIQKIIDTAKPNQILKLTANQYDNITLVINKPLVLSGLNSTLIGDTNKNIISVNVDGVCITNMNLIANNGTAIQVNGNGTRINNCTIKNKLESKLIDDYDSGKIVMPGSGIEIKNCENTNISKTNVYNFYNGIYLENTKNNQIIENNIIKNNYGIEFGKEVSNTRIEKNNINDNIGLITLDAIEGPLGYGISLKKSGVNVEILNNKINNNYMGIFIDAQNCTGIVITGNLISNSTIEGITFNENYTYSKNAIQPIVENNAIYNNAKGPSKIILGEVSANPAGIYGAGEWNDSLKLQLGANWYGTNKYTTWGNITGPGTICPRISTSLITFNLTYLDVGKYDIIFYNNGKIATSLPDFDVYFTLNFYTEKQIETIAHVNEGKAKIEFSSNNYFEKENVIEGSSGSLFDVTRLFMITYTYNIPDSEIPK